MSNYIQDIFNDLHGIFQDIFNDNIDEVASTLFDTFDAQFEDSESTLDNIITNAYLLRRTFELQPQHSDFDLFDNFNNFVEEQMRLQEELEDVKITLSENDFDKLNSTILDESLLYKCSICLEYTKISEELIILQCKHIYHKDCLKQWVTKNSTKCCECRFDIRDELK